MRRCAFTRCPAFCGYRGKRAVSNEKKLRLTSVVVGIIWIGILYVLVRENGDLTLEDFLRWRPKNPWLAALLICVLFALKSLDVLIHCGVLFALCGVLYPFPAALALNMLGVAIMAMIPYWLGYEMGADVADALSRKYKKLQTLDALWAQNEWVVTILFRTVGLPVNVAGIYMGARRFHIWVYLIGTLAGMLPITIAFTVMGMSIQNVRSPLFIGAVAAQIVMTILSLLIFRYLRTLQK